MEGKSDYAILWCKNFQWHPAVFGIKPQMLSIALKALDQRRFLGHLFNLTSTQLPPRYASAIFVAFSSSHVTNPFIP